MTRFSPKNNTAPRIAASLVFSFLCVAVLTFIASSAMANEPVQAGTESVIFTDDWDERNDGVWAGPAFWANPLQDWRIQDGRLECIQAGVTGGLDRNVHILTWQMKPESLFSLRVRVSRLSDDVKGWAGFRFASHGQFNEYRHNCIYGQGIDAGLRTDGVLVLDTETSEWTTASNEELNPWDEPIILELTVSPSDDSRAPMCDVRLSIINENGEAINSVTNPFPYEIMAGNLALVSHTEGNKREGQFAFEDLQLVGQDLVGGPDQNWGPVLWTQYTVQRKVLKLSAQFPPLSEDDPQEAYLYGVYEEEPELLARAAIDPLSRTATFRVENWNDTVDTPYAVAYGDAIPYKGVVRHDPVEKEEISVAGFTGHKDYGFPNSEIVDNVRRLDPDLLFFSGDQIYETIGGYGVKRDPLDIATLDYLRKWHLFGWSFGELLKDCPSVILPDDHDVYQGNVWGHGGRAATKFEQGGYVMAPEWVNMIQRTQTSHMPDPFDPTLCEQGIGVYYTNLNVGRIDFAILEDRKFKHGPANYAANADTSEAVMLGERQLEFLEEWSDDWTGTDMKATLSQTVFAQCHTHGGNEDRPLTQDRDANGWPPEGRDRAIRAIRKSFAFMYAGDNHLPTVVHHGIDDWEDAGVSFSVPSIAAGFPRAWRPESPGENRDPSLPEYTGRFTSAWGHPITFLAAANPLEWRGHKNTPPGDIEMLDLKRSGFGLVRFNKTTRDITIECYRILADLDDPENAQFDDWPVVINQMDNYGREAVAYLPTVHVEGMTNPVIVVSEDAGGLVYAVRILGNEFQPKVFSGSTHTMIIGDPDTNRIQRFEGYWPTPLGDDPGTLNVSFEE
jgi:alkaline phosphatase D